MKLNCSLISISYNHERIRYLIVLVGEVQPLVEGDGTVAVVVNGLEHVGRASLELRLLHVDLPAFKVQI